MLNHKIFVPRKLPAIHYTIPEIMAIYTNSVVFAKITCLDGTVDYY